MSAITKQDIDYFETKFRRSTSFWNRTLVLFQKMHNDDYHAKRTGPRKDLIEEILPLSILARNLECLGRKVGCRYIGRGHGRDGVLRLSGELIGPDPIEVKVEITIAESETAPLQRESIRLHGYAFGGSKIIAHGSERKGNRRIESEPYAYDPREDYDANLAIIKKAISKKSSIADHSDCLLLVKFDSGNILSDNDLYKLVMDLRDFAMPFGFRGVYICDVERARSLRICGKL